MNNETTNTTTLTFGSPSNTNQRLSIIGGLLGVYYIFCMFGISRGGAWVPGGGAFIVGILVLTTIFGRQKFWVCEPGILVIETSSMIGRASTSIRPHEIRGISVGVVKDSDGPDTFNVGVSLRSGIAHTFNHSRRPDAEAMRLSLQTALFR
jgi:hypothetical protein